MYRNKEVVHSGEAGDGVCFVINGIVKVACVDLKDTQDYFLGSGEPYCLSVGPSVCLSICWSVCWSVCWSGWLFVCPSGQVIVPWHIASTNG
jgi:hypothetical protein